MSKISCVSNKLWIQLLYILNTWFLLIDFLIRNINFPVLPFCQISSSIWILEIYCDIQVIILPAVGVSIAHRNFARLEYLNFLFCLYVTKPRKTHICHRVAQKLVTCFNPLISLVLFAYWCKKQKSRSDVLFVIVCHSSCVVGSNICKTKVLSQCAIVYSFLSWFFKFLRNYNTRARQILFFSAFVCGNT